VDGSYAARRFAGTGLLRRSVRLMRDTNYLFTRTQQSVHALTVLTTSRLRSHLLTNADIVKMFLPVDIKKSLEWSFRRALPTEKET